MSRGFVTIATGKERYYKMAANLLRSYRYYSADPEPFAIICDRENRYTDLFDKTIHMEKPTFSYVDKLKLPEYLPFDETIFIDADCLAYKDLNDFWKAFEDAAAFSAFGSNHTFDFPYGWFKKEGVGIYQDRITYIPDFIGGVYYLRKSEDLDRFYEIVKHIASTYHDYRFRRFENLADEPVYALAMSVCGFKTAGKKSPDICFYPVLNYFESDISTGTVIYENKYMQKRGRIFEAHMVHWGNGFTRDLPYMMEIYRLNRICAGKPLNKAGLAMAELRIRANIFVRIVYSKLKKAIKG